MFGACQPPAGPVGQCRPADLLPRPTPLPAQPISASLVQLVSRAPNIEEECRPVRFPSQVERALFRRTMRYLLTGRLALAREAAALLGFEVLEVDDGTRRYLVLQESADNPSLRGWGFYVVNPAAQRPLVLEAPHPVHDWNTGRQAAQLLDHLQAHALLVATTHRCASKHPTRCAGKTRACRQVWGKGRYRRSDRAHATNTLFHAAHQELLEGNQELVAVQIHGFRRRPGRTQQVVLSDGTRLPGGPDSHSNALARQMRRSILKSHRPLVRSCNETSRQRFLCGTQNVQGRHANGSVAPCRRAPRRSLNRFVQIEQTMEARRPGGSIDPSVLLHAMARHWSVPADNDADAAQAPPWAPNITPAPLSVDLP